MLLMINYREAQRLMGRAVERYTEELARSRNAMGPFIQLIEGELKRGGIHLEQRKPRSIRDFSHWYHSAVVALEELVAERERLVPATPRDIQLMCRCALSAVTLKEALELLCEFTAMMHPRIGQLTLHHSNQLSTLSLNPLREEQSTASSLVNITGLFSFYQLMQWLVETPIPLEHIDISATDREDLLPFIRLFDAPAIAGSKHLQLHFQAHWLELAVSRDKSEIAAFLNHFPCEIFTQSRAQLPRQVQALFMAAIRQQKPLPRIDELANSLGISSAGLRRSLAAQDSSIMALKNAARLECIRFYWLERGIPLNQLSRRLGFSDDISLRRAFYRWTGSSPSEWRQIQEDRANKRS